MATSTNNVKDGFQSEHPFVLIIEQPKKHVLFQCETAPILEEEVVQGVNYTSGVWQSYPSIKIVGYQGNVGILVTCVMKDQKNGKYSSHPHHVINVANVNETGFTYALIMREKMEIDPFKAGFEHKNSPNKIDLNSLRLCFQVFLIDEEETKSLTPVVTNVIYNKSQSPVIYNFSPTIGSSLGGTQVTLVGDNISKNDKVVMFEVNQNGKRVWEGVSSFRQSDLIKKSAVTFLTPAYERVIQQPVDVYVELRKSDGETSEAWPFTIHPEGLDGSIPLKRAQQTFQEINDSLHFTNICCKYLVFFFSLLIFFTSFCQSMYLLLYKNITYTHSMSVIYLYIFY
ncbi:embryonic polarity protein dorsal-like [Aphidius gifuensis]|uniref:embryonic polarity protein dorsal-like n=1 Tax=Aphidius gifuensis TaxID=684658 RepID=UPI001CDD4AFE|nr:embryonic polarity protein dorsal-like [Aphidius gifuensis]